jgi:hypothetical protein
MRVLIEDGELVLGGEPATHRRLGRRVVVTHAATRARPSKDADLMVMIYAILFSP